MSQHALRKPNGAAMAGQVIFAGTTQQGKNTEDRRIAEACRAGLLQQGMPWSGKPYLQQDTKQCKQGKAKQSKAGQGRVGHCTNLGQDFQHLFRRPSESGLSSYDDDRSFDDLRILGHSPDKFRRIVGRLQGECPILLPANQLLRLHAKHLE